MEFDPIQQSIIWSYFKRAKSLPGELTCFDYANDWFDGNLLIVNTSILVKDLTGASTGKKNIERQQQQKVSLSTLQ